MTERPIWIVQNRYYTTEAEALAEQAALNAEGYAANIVLNEMEVDGDGDGTRGNE